MMSTNVITVCFEKLGTRNSSGDETANVNFLYNDIVMSGTVQDRK